jgi:hypothetical protein
MPIRLAAKSIRTIQLENTAGTYQDCAFLKAKALNYHVFNMACQSIVFTITLAKK